MACRTSKQAWSKGLDAGTENSNSRTSNCHSSVFSKKAPILRIFCISGWLTVPINPDKYSFTVLRLMANDYGDTTYTEFTSLEYGQVAGSFIHDIMPKLAQSQLL